MKFNKAVRTKILVALLTSGVGVATWWMVTAKAPEGTPSKYASPATVAKPVTEDDLNTIMLTPEAEQRLGVRTAAIERKAVRRVRVYGGEVMVPVGRTTLVTAPLGGTLKAPSTGVPQVGRQVKKGQPVLLLLPLLTPEARTTLATARVDADGQVKHARTQLDAAKVALDRAKRLLREEAGSKRNVDESQAQYDLAFETLAAAEARRDFLAKTVGEIDKGTAAPISVESPQDGLLRNIAALPEQNVPSGTALFEVVNLDRVWVRVPVYVGDVEDIAESDEATVGSLTTKPGAVSYSARPVVAPPSANPLAATVDLFYEVDNHPASLTPGQRVGVSILLRGESESLAAPWSAVVHDIHGGTWVYEQIAPRTYVRRRVAVRYVVTDQAVLASGPHLGSQIVAAGAQEIFGSETGSSK
jgi:cobalt-zinc-cadmium efflux system membrane fusion protein